MTRLPKGPWRWVQNEEKEWVLVAGERVVLGTIPGGLNIDGVPYCDLLAGTDAGGKVVALTPGMPIAMALVALPDLIEAARDLLFCATTGRMRCDATYERVTAGMDDALAKLDGGTEPGIPTSSAST